ncbi:autotransporter-like protein [Prosthecobacter fusiformis]|uniref:Autotransporter-like protein n=1 Tax=Prosthecobacter fusiformis TaxID=48464 RepID=A0A4R7STZ2_9BACT|nr:autotransporter domain-containing protein [Prosthecobacter fusiformis]TDU81738.1 autotransporter-like protein [Prosthecobacter fusiformis]
MKTQHTPILMAAALFGSMLNLYSEPSLPEPEPEPQPYVVGVSFDPTNISGDGKTVIGIEPFAEGPSAYGDTGFVWTWESGTTDIYSVGGIVCISPVTTYLNPYGISQTGRYVVGAMRVDTVTEVIPPTEPPSTEPPSTEPPSTEPPSTEPPTVSTSGPSTITTSVHSAFILDRQTNTLTALTSEDGEYEVAYDVSDAGGSAVGSAWYDDGCDEILRALWWKNQGWTTPYILGALSGDSDETEALAMSGDGKRAVGYSEDGEGNTRAVSWNLDVQNDVLVTDYSVGAEDLGSLIEDGYSAAHDISRNGKYIVGESEAELTVTTSGILGRPTTTVPFIYTDAGGMKEIPLLAGNVDEGYADSGTANGVSNNGRVVGNNTIYYTVPGNVVTPNISDSSRVGFIYSASQGTRTIAQWLEDSGVELGKWNFATAQAISEDGKVVTGRAYDRRPTGGPSIADSEDFGYIAREGSGAINPDEFLPTTAASQAPAASAFSLLNLTMHGAHHIPLQMMGANRHAWATGDFARYDRNDLNSGLAEVGGAVDFFDKQLMAGLGIGQSWVTQDLANGGDMDMNGQYLLSELSFKPTKLPVVFTITGAIGSWDADIDRKYNNGGALDTSSGSTDVISSSLRFRVDWLDAVKVAGFGITPKLEYTVNRTEADGYTESGGGFPVDYDDQGHTAQEIRYGLSAARTFCSGKALLRLRAEGVHRFDQSGAVTSGQVVGLFNFNLPGQQIQQDWLHMGIDFNYALNEKITLTSSVMTSTSGEDPVFGGSLGVLMKF